MIHKLNWKRPAPLPLYLVDLRPDFPARAKALQGGDICAPFTARIGIRARREFRDFGLMIATPSGLVEREPTSEPFKGVIVERYDPPAVFLFVEEVIRSVQAGTWQEATETLAQVMWPLERRATSKTADDNKD